MATSIHKARFTLMTMALGTSAVVARDNMPTVMVEMWRAITDARIMLDHTTAST